MNLKKRTDQDNDSEDSHLSGGELTTPLERRHPRELSRSTLQRRASLLKRRRYYLLTFFLLLIIGTAIYLNSRSVKKDNSTSAEPPIVEPPLIADLLKDEQFEAPLSTKLASDWLGEIRVTVKPKETLTSIFKALGLPEAQGTAATTTIKKIEVEHNFKELITAGTALDFKFGQNQELLSVTLDFPNNRQIELKHGEGTTFIPIIKKSDELASDRTAFGTVESSFSEAAIKAGVDYDIIDDFVDLFSDRVEFKKELQPGDRFTLVYRKRDPLKASKAGDPEIIAAAMEVNGKQHFVARFQGADGKYRYFDERGEPLGNTFLRYPLKFSRITSYFTTARFHPILKVNKPHNGIDFAAPIGTPVRTVADGIVLESGMKGGAGNMIKIKHNERYTTVYMHLSAISHEIKPGARVHRGDVIGAVGMTGLATGPHLHFGFFDHDVYVDPLKIQLPTLDLLPTLAMSDTYLKRVVATLTHFQSIDVNQLQRILKNPNHK